MAETESEQQGSARDDKRALLTWRSGGWVIALSALFLAFVSLQLFLNYQRNTEGRENALPAAGTSIEEQLAESGEEEPFSLIPLDEVYWGVQRKDSIPALTDFETIPAGSVKQHIEESHVKYLLSNDRVIGVEINGEARAYPLSILNYHEIANDTLGGVPIAVTYCPLCDSAAVFERTVAGEVLEFGVSGQLYNSNVLMYDRREDDGDESLWSQLMMRAVVGPAAEQGHTLTPVPSELIRWAAWKEKHPDSTVLSVKTGWKRKYSANPYKKYALDQNLHFPVTPAESDYASFDRMVLVKDADGMWAYAQKEIKEEMGEATELRKDGLVFRYEKLTPAMDPPTLNVYHEDGTPAALAYTYRFAWYALIEHADMSSGGETSK